MKTMESTKEKRRIATFDILRGYFLFVIMIDHIMRSFNIWEVFTGRGAQWVSAAEGFFFVSGIMIGMVRGASMNDRSIIEVFKKCWSRAITLYVWSIGLTILFSLLALCFVGSLGLKDGYFTGSLANFLGKTLTLHFSYGWADFLSFYAVYIFFAPLAIWLLRKRLWQVVMALSLLVWIQTNTMMGGWQIIFFSGLICGYYKHSIENFWRSLKTRTRQVISLSIYALTSVTLMLSIFFTTLAEEYGKSGSSGKFLIFNVSGANDFSIYTLRSHFDKVSMQPLRLILFFIWFSALFMLVRRFEGKINKQLGWFLITLGQNSLYVYILSAILLFCMDLLVPGGLPWLLNTLLSTAFIGVVWYATKRKFLFKIIPR